MYVKVTNGSPEIYTIGQLRKDNPNTSFPKSIPQSTLAAYNIYPYTIDEEPVYDPETQKLEFGSLYGSGSTWTQGWNIVPLTQDEVAERKAQRQEQFEQAIQKNLDDEAKVKGYDGIVSACSYAGHPNPFQAEGQAAIEWRGAVWTYAYTELAKVEAGTRTQPTIEEFLLELPSISWPA